MEQKIIDIIIPAYNAHSTIDKAIASIAVQTISNLIRVTIVNDGSNESYQRTIDKFNEIIDIQEITLSTNTGCGHARQVGIDSTSLPYIVFVDADDVLYSATSIARLLLEFEKNTSLRVAYGAINEIRLETGEIAYIEPNHWTWIFGSMYSRRFLQDFNVRFYNNSAGEDTGFNKIIKLLSNCATISFISDVVYLWTDSNKEGRINTDEFVYEKSKSGLIDNIIYAHNIVKQHGIPIEVLVLDAMVSICSLYFGFVDLMRYNESGKDEYVKHCKKFYEEIYKQYIPYITKSDLSDIYNDNLRNYNKKSNIPIDEISFVEFVMMLN